METGEELTKRFFIRLLIGGVPLVFFAIALFAKGESGNSGMSPNMSKFIPVALIFAWGAFLVIEALYLFAKSRNSAGLCSVFAVAILAACFFVIMYLEHRA